jgi:hypothetical protein
MLQTAPRKPRISNCAPQAAHFKLRPASRVPTTKQTIEIY